jgi:hypothetical protein
MIWTILRRGQRSGPIDQACPVKVGEHAATMGTDRRQPKGEFLTFPPLPGPHRT